MCNPSHEPHIVIVIKLEIYLVSDLGEQLLYACIQEGGLWLNVGVTGNFILAHNQLSGYRHSSILWLVICDNSSRLVTHFF